MHSDTEPTSSTPNDPTLTDLLGQASQAAEILRVTLDAIRRSGKTTPQTHPYVCRAKRDLGDVCHNLRLALESNS